MEVSDEPFEQAWDGPLSNVRGLPRESLGQVVLSFTHSSSADDIRQVLVGVLGEPVKRSALLGKTTLRYESLPAKLVASRKKAELRISQRIKPKRLSDLLAALSAVQGASGLRVAGLRRRFEAPGTNAGTPQG